MSLFLSLSTTHHLHRHRENLKPLAQKLIQTPNKPSTKTQPKPQTTHPPPKSKSTQPLTTQPPTDPPKTFQSPKIGLHSDFTLNQFPLSSLTHTKLKEGERDLARAIADPPPPLPPLANLPLPPLFSLPLLVLSLSHSTLLSHPSLCKSVPSLSQITWCGSGGASMWAGDCGGVGRWLQQHGLGVLAATDEAKPHCAHLH